MVKTLTPKPFRDLNPNELKKMYMTRLARKAMNPDYNKNKFDLHAAESLVAIVKQIYGLRDALTKNLERHLSSVKGEFGFLPSGATLDAWGPTSARMKEIVDDYYDGKYDADIGFGADTFPVHANNYLCRAKAKYTTSAKVQKEKAEKEAQMQMLAEVAEAEKKKQEEEEKKKAEEDAAKAQELEKSMLMAHYVRSVATHVRDKVNGDENVVWSQVAKPIPQLMTHLFDIINAQELPDPEKRKQSETSGTTSHALRALMEIVIFT